MKKYILRIIIAICFAAGIILFLFVSPIFNIKEITVEGESQISEGVYISLSEIKIGQNIFEIDKESIKSRIKEEPYVESVKIDLLYPDKVKINVTERYTSYMVEENGMYFYLDRNGYLLEKNYIAPDVLLIKGYTTDFENLEVGSRIGEEDLSKFNDLIKITDAITNNNIDTKLTSINISDHNNYILEFNEEGKTIELGDTSDLSAKMSWINFFMVKNKEDKGTIYLNKKEIYFSPERPENVQEPEKVQ